MAILESRENVSVSLKNLLKEKSVLSDSETENSITLTNKGEWTVLVVSNHMPMPALSLELSKLLDTRVITLGYSQNDGAVHYSEINKGILEQVYTHIMEEATEKSGIKLVDVYNKAINTKVFNVLPGFNPTEEDLEGGSQEYFSVYSGLDLLYIPNEPSSIEDEVIFVKSFPFKEYGGNMTCLTWESLL